MLVRPENHDYDSVDYPILGNDDHLADVVIQDAEMQGLGSQSPRWQAVRITIEMRPITKGAQRAFVLEKRELLLYVYKRSNASVCFESWSLCKGLFFLPTMLILKTRGVQYVHGHRKRILLLQHAQ